MGHGGSDGSKASREYASDTSSHGTINMPARQSTWTDERVELLKSCFEAGLSCRDIAGEIGVSRNAVIGKLSRLNLTRDESRDARRPARKDAPKKKRPRSLPRLQYQMLKAVYGESQPAADDEPIHDGHNCSLLELSEERCRWPISTPGAADFCFCGNTPLEGLPYCAGHTRIAYRPGSRQRVARG
jgi:GcrA cell cycle regulator